MGLEPVPAHVIEARDSAGNTVLRICGELDTASRASVEPSVLTAISSNESVTIDLGELTFCDSSGIAMFIAADELARAEGTTLAIRQVLPNVRRVFEITKIDSVITITE